MRHFNSILNDIGQATPSLAVELTAVGKRLHGYKETFTTAAMSIPAAHLPKFCANQVIEVAYEVPGVFGCIE